MFTITSDIILWMILIIVSITSVISIFKKGISINNNVQYPTTHNYYYGEEEDVVDE